VYDAATQRFAMMIVTYIVQHQHQVQQQVRIKVVKHNEMPKAGPKKSICHSQKLEMILK